MFGKRKCDAQNVNSTEKSRKAITLEIKHEILSHYESGMKVNELASKFKLSHSNVSTILKDKEKYLKDMKRARPMQSTVIRKRDGLIPEVKKLLIAWINDKKQRIHMPLNKATISAKTLSLFETFNRGDETSKDEVFSASKGWFDRFRERAGWLKIRVQGEAASADNEAARNFPEELAEIIEEEGYCSRHVFNVDETGLFRKRMPSRSYIAEEEKSVPGYKAAKDRLTLLLGENAGDCKLKPLLVHRAENPRALKGFVT
jgi:Asp-tRNA(Asn)/Glu-tRNA(Gln) amidotransferase B subunit